VAEETAAACNQRVTEHGRFINLVGTQPATLPGAARAPGAAPPAAGEEASAGRSPWGRHGRQRGPSSPQPSMTEAGASYFYVQTAPYV